MARSAFVMQSVPLSHLLSTIPLSLVLIQGNGRPISSVNNRFVVVDTTGSLIVYSSGPAETLNFYCTASNMFGSSVRSSNNFTVEFFMSKSLQLVLAHDIVEFCHS